MVQQRNRSNKEKKFQWYHISRKSKSSNESLDDSEKKVAQNAADCDE